jgi:hypothetical protein
MPRRPSPFPDLRRRLEEAEARAKPFQDQGLPFPTGQLLTEFDQAVRAGDVERAEGVVKRAEALLARATEDWGWLSELLQRVDGLRAIAETVGLDLARIDAQVGNPRGQLLSEPLTTASLEKVAASASFALAVLNDALPKYIVQEAQALGVSIRRARDRGEEVREAVAAFTSLLRAVQDPVLGTSAERLVEVRRAVARIPRAPAVAAVSPEEEDEILREARNLARRLHRIKTRAHDATDAVRLITQVRSALSEDRRYASPEEEVEALWAEVDRLTREKRLATSSAPPDLPGPKERRSTSVLQTPVPADDDEEEEVEEEAPRPSPPPIVAAPMGPPPPSPTTAAPKPTGAAKPAPIPVPERKPAPYSLPIVPPVAPLPDEHSVAPPPPPNPDLLADGTGPRAPRRTRIAIAAAYVPPDLSSGLMPLATPTSPAPPPSRSGYSPEEEDEEEDEEEETPEPAGPEAPPPSIPGTDEEDEVPPSASPPGPPALPPPPPPSPRRARSRHRE